MKASQTLFVLAAAIGGIHALSMPSVRYSGRRVIGVPHAEHRPLAQGFHVIESEDCDARGNASAVMDLPERCRFLYGAYRYVLKPVGQLRQQFIIPFGVVRASAGSYAFLSQAPIHVESTEPTDQ